MDTNKTDGRLISFDEAGFTGPELLNEQQPYFVYASHDLSTDEAETLISELRRRYRFQSDELKASRLKKRGDWLKITEELCVATQGRSKVIVHNKKVALAGKFVEYIFEPVLAEKSKLFYAVNFHRYLMMAVYSLISSSSAEYVELAEQMQIFMRTFDPSAAPDIFSNTGEHPVEMDRILRFCRGYARAITEATMHLRPEKNMTGKWTLDLTSTALFSLLFFNWGHRYPLLRLLCDESKPLAAGADLFNSWVGKDQSSTITDGRASHKIKGNLVAPVEFGSSTTHPTIQVADLLAGIAFDIHIKGERQSDNARSWLRKHQFHEHSIDVVPEMTKTSNSSVRVGREILKELARRADSSADPLDGMEDFIRRVTLRIG